MNLIQLNYPKPPESITFGDAFRNPGTIPYGVNHPPADIQLTRVQFKPGAIIQRAGMTVRIDSWGLLYTCVTVMKGPDKGRTRLWPQPDQWIDGDVKRWIYNNAILIKAAE